MTPADYDRALIFYILLPNSSLKEVLVQLHYLNNTLVHLTETIIQIFLKLTFSYVY